MKLEFEYTQEVGSGNDAALMHLWDNEANLLHIENGRMWSKYAYTDGGEWENREFIEDVDISIHDSIEYFRIENFGGWGAVGSYKDGDTHYLLIYEYQQDMTDYLSSASIHHSIDDPISTFNLELDNPIVINTKKNNVAVSIDDSNIMPGSKIIFKFTIGDDQPDYDMGIFYVDRINFDELSETVSIEGRNKIGKVLSDQSLDELNEYWIRPINDILKELLINAHLTKKDFSIEATSKTAWFKFENDMTYYEAIDHIFESLPTWMMRENDDGVITIGSPQYGGFNQPQQYTFVRNTDIFTRNIVRDDAETYRRVCVHTPEFAQTIYGDVETFKGWSINANKTLYVEVAEGSSYDKMYMYLQELLVRLKNVGQIETFNGPFRPHIQIGDAATIVDTHVKNLGLITEINHEAGKDGFYTNFTVDSGGTLSTGRVSDYIKKITGERKKATSEGNKPVGEDLRNITYLASVYVSSERYYRDSELLTDGRTEDRDGWQPDYDDPRPSFVLDFGRQCDISKINLWLGYDDSGSEGPNYYEIEYWDSRRWNHLLEASSDISGTMEHEFESVSTSAIRFSLEQKTLGRQVWREVEVWGKM